jgi:beta-N-acetylhexosaminidase
VTARDDVLRRLALAVLLPGVPGRTPPAWLCELLAHGLAGVVLFERNVDPDDPDGGVAAYTAALRAARPDALVAVDEEGGDVTRLDAVRGSRVPGPAALGRVDDVALTRRVAREVGARLARAGVPLVLAPVADVDSDPDSPVIGIRSFGADPALVARHVTATVAGLHDAGVAATAKHFPGHGATHEDSHLTAPALDVAADVLERRELVPFRAAVLAGVDVVMTAHVRYAALDDALATLSPRIVTGLLRGDLGFEGVVMSDALDMHAITRTVGRTQGAVLALAAGVDALCVGGESLVAGQVESVAAGIVEAVRDGRLPAGRLEEAADRVDGLARRCRDGLLAAGRQPDGRPGDAGAEAARRALEVSEVVPLAAPPLVAELAEPGSIPAGDVPWAVGAALAALVPGTEVLSVPAGLDGGSGDEPAEVAAGVVRWARGRPLVLSARSTRVGHPARAVVAAVAAARSDAVLVDHGLPGPPLPLPTVRTWSASRASAQAAAEVLAGTRRWLPSSP